MVSVLPSGSVTVTEIKVSPSELGKGIIDNCLNVSEEILSLFDTPEIVIPEFSTTSWFEDVTLKDIFM